MHQIGLFDATSAGNMLAIHDFGGIGQLHTVNTDSFSLGMIIDFLPVGDSIKLKFPVYKDKNQEESVRKSKQRIAELEQEPLAENKAEVVAHIHHMMQATSAEGVKSHGGFKKGATGTTSAIDEDTNAAVIAHLQMEDPFGNGVPINSPFVSGRISITLFRRRRPRRLLSWILSTRPEPA